PFNEHLLCEVMESEARIRTPEETIRRAVTLFSLASYAHGMLAEKPDRNKELDTFNARDKQYDLRPFLTEKEKAYLADPKPEQSANWPFEWRYEAAHPLFWATGIVDELRFPSEISDIQAMGDFLDKQRDMDELLSRIRMRSEAEILDAADLTLRYDWACVEARINNQDAPAELNGDIVMERHYAFNWLIGSNNGADWDDIHPHT
ncbi:MAG: DUF4272 domain-containing protein, partial [Rikenella sp.]|nr:DUF4272 domain-containing protein [Rikenella sp.]